MSNSARADRIRRAVEAAVDKTIEELEPGPERRTIRAELVAAALAEYAAALRGLVRAPVPQYRAALETVDRIEKSINYREE